MARELEIFSGLIGQEHAARILSAAAGSGRPAHAYLFTGPPGVGKQEAALKFAAALCCEQGGCGGCDSCRKAAEGVHPDIVTVTPAGSRITVDQVRDINAALNFHPHESRARVFIIAGAEALGTEGANAFLKSLEEPPPFVFFLLLAPDAAMVLPTIASRCQEVRFGALPVAGIEAHLVEAHGVSTTMAQAYARVSGGNLALAGRLCRDSALASRRQGYLKMAQRLARGECEGGTAPLVADILDAAREVGEAAGDAAAGPEGFGEPDSRRAKQDAHRRDAAAQRREVELALGFLQSWFRDLMAVAAGAGASVLNRDYELELEDQALSSRTGDYRRALEVIEAARAKLGYNIDLELCLQAMFLELQEVL